MTRTFKFLTGLLAAHLFAATAVHAASNAELKFRSAMGLQDYQVVEYKDAQGAKMDFSPFQQKLGADQQQLAARTLCAGQLLFFRMRPCVKEAPMLNAFADRPTLANGRELIEKVGVKMYPKFALLNPHGALIALGGQNDIGDKRDALEQWVQSVIDQNSH